MLILAVDAILGWSLHNLMHQIRLHKKTEDPKKFYRTEPKLIKYPYGFWYLENRNRIQSEPKNFRYPNLSEIDLDT